MKISAFQSMPNFYAKKTLYTDFDETYFPFTREDIKKENAPRFDRMYLPFDEFRKSQGEDFRLVVTTGRSKNDYLHTEGLIQNNNLSYCFPDKLITCNGANVFKFQNNRVVNVYPKKDDRAIGVADEIVNLIKEYDEDIKVIKCKINGDKKTYQKESSEYKLDRLKPQKYISVAKDGKYNAEIVISKNIDFFEITSLIKKYIDENDLPFIVEHHRNAVYTKGFEYINNEKIEVRANLILLKYTQNKTLIDKLDIIKKEVKRIQENNSDEYIIIAGDGYNDMEMLNPLNYIESDKDIDNPEVLAKLQALPLKIIICGGNPVLDGLRDLASKLTEKGINIAKIAPNSSIDFIQALKDCCDEIE